MIAGFLFYFILFYFILFYFILFYFILFYLRWYIIRHALVSYGFRQAHLCCCIGGLFIFQNADSKKPRKE